MKRYFINFIVIFFAGLADKASAKCVEINQSNCVEFFQFADPIGERYRTLTILNAGKVVRVLTGEEDVGGTFERIAPTLLSPSKNIAFVSQIESGEVEISDGLKAYHEVAYCELVDLRNGCIIARETGEFCGGNFAQDNKWENSVYSDFDLIGEVPKAKKYVDGNFKFTDSPVSTFENLLFCDPPDNTNKSFYRVLVEENIVELNTMQREFLKEKLK